jgi:excisionase family DNA binding protein
VTEAIQMGTTKDERVNKPDDTQIWLVTKEAAARARVGPKTVFREVHAGRLKAARVGGRRELRFRPAWVDQWLEERSTPVVINGRDRVAA